MKQHMNSYRIKRRVKDGVQLVCEINAKTYSEAIEQWTKKTNPSHMAQHITYEDTRRNVMGFHVYRKFFKGKFIQEIFVMRLAPPAISVLKMPFDE